MQKPHKHSSTALDLAVIAPLVGLLKASWQPSVAQVSFKLHRLFFIALTRLVRCWWCSGSVTVWVSALQSSRELWCTVQGTYTMMAREIDGDGQLVDPIRVDWTTGGMVLAAVSVLLTVHLQNPLVSDKVMCLAQKYSLIKFC